MNASECIARGCTLQCAMLSPTFRVRDFEVLQTSMFYDASLVHLTSTGVFCFCFCCCTFAMVYLRLIVSLDLFQTHAIIVRDLSAMPRLSICSGFPNLVPIWLIAPSDIVL